VLLWIKQAAASKEEKEKSQMSIGHMKKKTVSVIQ